MISLNYRQIRNSNFSAALRKLGNHSGFNGKQAYHIGRIVDKALSFERQCVQEENKIHLKYARTNEDGTRYIPEGKPASYFEIPEEKQADHDAAMEELFKETVQIDKYKIPLKDFDNTGLTPAQMVALEPIIDDSEEAANVLSITKKEETGQNPQPTA